MQGLKTKSLTAMVDSLSIGSTHRGILQEKLTEFHEILSVRKRQLEEEYRAHSQANEDSNPSGLPKGQTTDTPSSEDALKSNQQYELDVLQELFQERLDQLYHKFQREWESDPRENVSSFPLPETGNESAYLSQQLGDALGHGLAEVCERRPTDPIEYLASWLRKYAENIKDQQQAAIIDLKVKLQQEEDVMMKDKQAIIVRERQQIKQEENRRRIFLEHASGITNTESPQLSGPESPRADTPARDEPNAHRETSTKHVRTADTEGPNTLYTIEEKDSETQSGNNIDAQI